MCWTVGHVRNKNRNLDMMHDLLQPTEIALRRSSGVAHLYVRLDHESRLKRLMKVSTKVLAEFENNYAGGSTIMIQKCFSLSFVLN